MKIVAIGGGDHGANGKPYQTEAFDREIVALSNKRIPNFLFIAFASKTAENAEKYYNEISANFQRLSCHCDHLRECDLKSEQITAQKISRADIIYVGGGDTMRLIRLIKKHGLDGSLRQAGERGAVLCGLSAGAICWFAFGNSASRKFKSDPKKLVKVSSLGFVSALFCPHFNSTAVARQSETKRMLKGAKEVALGLDDCAAISINGDSFKIMRSKATARALKCFWLRGKYFELPIPEQGSLSILVSK